MKLFVSLTVHWGSLVRDRQLPKKITNIQLASFSTPSTTFSLSSTQGKTHGNSNSFGQSTSLKNIL